MLIHGKVVCLIYLAAVGINEGVKKGKVMHKERKQKKALKAAGTKSEKEILRVSSLLALPF